MSTDSERQVSTRTSNLYILCCTHSLHTLAVECANTNTWPPFAKARICTALRRGILHAQVNVISICNGPCAPMTISLCLCVYTCTYTRLSHVCVCVCGGGICSGYLLVFHCVCVRVNKFSCVYGICLQCLFANVSVNGYSGSKHLKCHMLARACAHTHRHTHTYTPLRCPN